jgi:phytoene synthase
MVEIEDKCSIQLRGNWVAIHCGAGAAIVTDLKESYALCQRLARRSASNFNFSFLLLPPQKRKGMWALYAFLRQVDDLADDDTRDANSRRQALQTLRNDLSATLAGRSRSSILPAVADTVARFKIPVEYLTAVIDGVEMDLDRKPVNTFAELEIYCHRVASVVGLACIHIWGFRGTQALEPARNCGLAFQLTNILRDLKEDGANQRVYLPREDLQRFGYSADELQRGVADERFIQLMHFEIARAERFYDSASQLERHLDRDGRRVFRAMTSTYQTLLAKIKADPPVVFRDRVRLRHWEKIRIGLHAFLARPLPIRSAAACKAVSP